MKAWYIVKHGEPATAFELRDAPDPVPGPGEVKIDVEAFGLNYADVQAARGLYQDAPPIPSLVGYEVVGRIAALGAAVPKERFKTGMRVVAFTRFGGYATQAVSPWEGVVEIPEDMPNGVAAALAVQYTTAWYCMEEAVHLVAGDTVLIHAAAGGVGTALVQLARRKKLRILGTAGSDAKLKYLRDQGVDVPINYQTQDFAQVVREHAPGGLDAAFDSLGGETFRKSAQLLRAGGRIVGFGAADMGQKKNPFRMLKVLAGFGLIVPPLYLMNSKGFVGVNMLKIADQRRDILKRCLDSVAELARRGEVHPHVGGVFRHTELPKAHELLGSRSTMGKLVVEWGQST